MPNFVYITGFEHGESPMSNAGQGLISGSAGSPTLVSGSLARSGDYALMIDATGASKYIMLPSTRFTGSNNPGNLLVGRFYFKFDSFPASSRTAHVAAMNGLDLSMRFRSNDNGVLMGFEDAGASRLDYTIVVTGTWYRVDFRSNWSAPFYTVDWQIDGVNKAQNWFSGSASSQVSGFRLGSSSTLTYTIYFDDVAVSMDSADYPIGPGKVIGLRPNSDGTHNAGTNVMEDQTGADINGTTVTAYSLMNVIPWVTGTATWVQQVVNGTSNYVEINFEDVPSGVDIHGVQGVLGYKAATTTLNAGAGYILNTNNIGTELWGLPSGTKDYSEASPFYKNNIITPPAGGWTKAAVDGLKGRFGYSDDANPDPYWLHAILEVDYAEPIAPQPSGIFVNTYVGNPSMSRSGTVAELDFETGNFSPWTLVVDDNGKIGVTGSAAMANTAYGMIVSHGGGSVTSRYASYDFVQPEANGTIRARFYADPNSFATVGKDTENVFVVRNSTDDWLLTVNMGRDALENYIASITLFDDVGALYTSSDVQITDAPHWFEVLGRRAAGNNISGGYLQLWIDDVSGTAVQGIDNFTRWNNVNNIRVGAVGSIEATTSGSYFLDEFVLNNTGNYIGPKPSGGPPVYSLSGTSITINTYVGNPYFNQEHALRASGIYCNTYVGNSYLNQEHALAGSGIYVNTYVGTPYLNQEHALQSSGIFANTYVSNPYLSQEHALRASGIYSNTYIGNPYLSQEHALQASGIFVNTYVSSSYLSQEHAHQASGIYVNTYVGNPYLSQEHALSASGIFVNTYVGNPYIGQEHLLSAGGIYVNTYVGSQYINQEHQLSASGIFINTYVGNPTLTEVGPGEMAPIGITVSTYVGNSYINQEHALGANGITITPSVGIPYINQTHILSGSGIVVGATVGNPILSAGTGLTPSDLTIGGDVGNPAISQTHVFGSGGIGSGPVVGQPGPGQEHILTIGGITISSTIGSPTLVSPPVVGGLFMHSIFKKMDQGIEKGMINS